MASERVSSVERQMRTLWSLGTVGDLGDSALLSRFILRQDDSATEAFRVLVERHGPMVLRVCQQVLGDRHDAEDAAQAVFLLLARKASAIRVDASLGPWLHGVSRRVAAKARVRTAARRTLERRTALVAASIQATERGESPSTNDWQAVHDEVDRLPQKYRAPVVLCYLEGQTYEETARRIGCPIGTVRVRLSRARERLRDRLTRRGLAPERAILPDLVATSPDERSPHAVPGPPFLAPCGAAWTEATVKAADAVSLGRAAMTGTVSASVLSLYEGVVRAMLVNRGMMAATWVLGSGMTFAGAIVLAAGGAGTQDEGTSSKKQPAVPVASVAKEKEVAPPLNLDSPDELRKANERRLEAAQRRLEAQRTYYNQGRITIDRLGEASRQVMLAETALATTKEERVAAAKAHWERTNEIFFREGEQLNLGRGTIADLSEARVAHEEAGVLYMEARQSQGTGEVEVLKNRLETLEKQLQRVTNRLEKLEGAQRSKSG